MYKPGKTSIAGIILPIIASSTVPLKSIDIHDLKLKNVNKKRIPLSQIGQALYTLSENGLVNRKIMPGSGKKKIYTYYPLALPNPTASPDIIYDTDAEVRKVLSKAVTGLLASACDPDFEGRLLDAFNDIGLGVLKQHSSLTTVEMALLLESI